MSNDKERLKEHIDVLVSVIDPDKIRSADEPDDPMLLILWLKVRDGQALEAAITQMLEELDTLSMAILDILDYPPTAIMGIELARKLEERGLVAEDPQMSAALSYLGKKCLVDQINGWYFKAEPPVEVTLDDLDWLHGTGRYAQ